MSRRNFISRKALGPVLKVRQQAFAGVNVDQTLSKIKSSQNVGSSYFPKKNTSEILNTGIATISRSIKAERTFAKRFVGHSAVLILAALVLGFTHFSGSNSLAIANQNGGVGVADDRISLLQTGAILATSTNSVIAEDIQTKANTASSQIYLATAGDNFLQKRQPISTAGSVTRDITNYKVQDGDTLWSISSKFNITTDTVKWANDLNDDSVLNPGAALTILPVNGLLLTAQGGDDIAAIANKYQSSASLIDSYNNLEGNAPAAGQKLIVPDGVMPAAPKPVVQVAVAAPRATAPSFTPTYGGFNGYSYGYCTWYVASRRSVPSNWGNASSWYYNAQYSGYGVGSAPAPGAIAWERGNHVALVESVSGSMVTVSEMNYYSNGGGWNRVSRRTVPASTFLYIY